jgi:hypothetical protein
MNKEFETQFAEFFSKGGVIKKVPVKTKKQVMSELKVKMADADWRRRNSVVPYLDDHRDREGENW